MDFIRPEDCKCKYVQLFDPVRQPIPENECNSIQKRLLGRPGSKHTASIGGMSSRTSGEPEIALSGVL